MLRLDAIESRRVRGLIEIHLHLDHVRKAHLSHNPIMRANYLIEHAEELQFGGCQQCPYCIIRRMRLSASTFPKELNNLQDHDQEDYYAQEDD